jgi:hypothetical protein
MRGYLNIDTNLKVGNKCNILETGQEGEIVNISCSDYGTGLFINFNVSVTMADGTVEYFPFTDPSLIDIYG